MPATMRLPTPYVRYPPRTNIPTIRAVRLVELSSSCTTSRPLSYRSRGDSAGASATNTAVLVVSSISAPSVVIHNGGLRPGQPETETYGASPARKADGARSLTALSTNCTVQSTNLLVGSEMSTPRTDRWVQR